MPMHKKHWLKCSHCGENVTRDSFAIARHFKMRHNINLSEGEAYRLGSSKPVILMDQNIKLRPAENVCHHDKPRKKRRSRGRSMASKKPKLSNPPKNYIQKRKQKIEATHKISGYNRKKVKLVQGGSPGLGKNA
ncbi:hypothetical protein [Hahella sp. HN01]|uniref:hypothetical protein n=1 Tax=Hahella sp. HN01 TaxID=2847262 RepID=UPI001C1E92D0|nr:hypothetical protein [Hahella sp. HN01]MBU6953663.1 hypothetical protein [Hahella sp. HN01]